MTRTLNDPTPDEWDAVARKWEAIRSESDGEEYREARKRHKIMRLNFIRYKTSIQILWQIRIPIIILSLFINILT